MIWQSASEFWAMGGYGVYVWGSMGVSAALMALEVWLARMGRRQALDAVCDAMDTEAQDTEAQDTEAQDTEAPGAAQAFSAVSVRPLHHTQGAAS
jgi:heme exporter protein D